MSVLELKVYDIFKTRFTEAEAAVFIEYIESKTVEKVEKKSEVFEQIIQKDISNLELRIEKRFSEMNKTIYLVRVIQFIAIVGSVLAIVSFARQSVTP